MDVFEAVRSRHSVRAFKADPLPRAQVEEVLGLALNAPSAINLQPWEFYVVMGEERERLSRRLIKAYREKQISCSPGNVKPLSAEFSKRGVESFQLMNPCLEKMGLPFDRFVNEGSCNFYGAPVALILCLDNAFSKARLVDIGIVLGYLTLIAFEAGLGTCPIGLISAYEDEIREHLDIPESKDVVIGMALGRPDPDNPLNGFATPRERLSAFAKWYD
ncbi:MAG TPA: nitroreductase [Syntrophorhabdaceae bacterium]